MQAGSEVRMTIGEVIKELQKYNPDGIVELGEAGGSMGSSWTGWMSADALCESVRETKEGVVLSQY